MKLYFDPPDYFAFAANARVNTQIGAIITGDLPLQMQWEFIQEALHKYADIAYEHAVVLTRTVPEPRMHPAHSM